MTQRCGHTPRNTGLRRASQPAEATCLTSKVSAGQPFDRYSRMTWSRKGATLSSGLTCVPS